MSKLWLKLFCDTLIFISYCNVDVLDIFKFINSCLDKKQIDYSYIKKELLECISYNSVIDNKYYKDIIYRDLKNILREHAYLDGTSLGIDSDGVFEKLIYNFEQSKEDVMRLRR